MTETAPVATGLLKQVRLASETTWGVAPGATGGSPQLLRRVSSDIALTKATYASQEIQPDRQIHDFRHGVRKVGGTIKSELSPLTYGVVFSQLLANNWASGPTGVTGATVTAVAAVSNASPGEFTLSASDWVTAGFHVGDVVRFAGFASTPAANNARNYRITGFSKSSSTNDTMQVGPTPSTAYPSVGNEAVVAAAGATGINCTLVGQQLYIAPAGAAVDQSFTIEHWYTDVLQSELFTGCRANNTTLRLPPTGIATIDFSVLGKDTTLSGTSAYFTSPTAVTSTGLSVSVNGLLRLNGADIAIVTGLDFTIDPRYTTETIVGSNVTPYLFPGIMDIKGTLTALFLDETINNLFINETDYIQMHVYLTLSSAVNTDFLSFFFPRLKLTSSNKDDKPGALVQTVGFQALQNLNGGAGTGTILSPLVIQDSVQ